MHNSDQGRLDGLAPTPPVTSGRMATAVDAVLEEVSVDAATAELMRVCARSIDIREASGEDFGTLITTLHKMLRDLDLEPVAEGPSATIMQMVRDAR